MSLKADLESAGWHLSQEGIDLCSQELKEPTAKDVIKKVMRDDITGLALFYFIYFRL